METNFVILPPIDELDIALREGDDRIMLAARRYIDTIARVRELLPQVKDELISGTAATIYLKRMGHRALTLADSENIIKAVGSEEDKKVVSDFAQAQLDIQARLKDTKVIGLVLEQSNIPRDLFYKRSNRPDLWKAEQVIQVMEVLERLRV